MGNGVITSENTLNIVDIYGVDGQCLRYYLRQKVAVKAIGMNVEETNPTHINVRSESTRVPIVNRPLIVERLLNAFVPIAYQAG